MPEISDTPANDNFAEFIRSISSGAFHDEATEALKTVVREIVRVAEASGGKPKGKLVLTINMQMDRGVMDVNPDVKITTPSTVRARSIMYPTRDGGLSRTDQRQLALPGVRDAMPDVRDIRSVTK